MIFFHSMIPCFNVGRKTLYIVVTSLYKTKAIQILQNKNIQCN